MADLDFGAIAVLYVIFQILVHGIPEFIIGAAGAISIRKGYVKSGGTIIVSAVLALLNNAASFAALRFFPLQDYQELYIYIIQGVGWVSSGLLCGGLLGIALSIPRTPR